MTDTAIEPAWLTIARSHLGVREYTSQQPGPNGELSNPQVEAWQRLAGIRRPDDEIPWCAAFVTGVMHESGDTNFASSSARAWARFGKRLTAPRLGCIVVLWRESRESHKGHVGFYVGPDPINPARILMLSGNAGNAVTIKPFPLTRVDAYVWPKRWKTSSSRSGGPVSA